MTSGRLPAPTHRLAGIPPLVAHSPPSCVVSLLRPFSLPLHFSTEEAHTRLLFANTQRGDTVGQDDLFFRRSFASTYSGGWHPSFLSEALHENSFSMGLLIRATWAIHHFFGDTIPRLSSFPTMPSRPSTFPIRIKRAEHCYPRLSPAKCFFLLKPFSVLVCIILVTYFMN